MTAIIGIDPRTKRCEIVATNSPENAEEIRTHSYICVHVSKVKAKEVWGEIIEDIYLITSAPNLKLSERE